MSSRIGCHMHHGKTELGEFLRRRRLELGLSQEKIADNVEVSRNYVSLIELGKIGLCESDGLLLKIAKILDLDVNVLKDLRPSKRSKKRDTELGAIIVDRRHEMRLSQSEFASLAGLRVSQIIGLERGTIKRPNPVTITKLEKVLGFKINTIIRYLNTIIFSLVHQEVGGQHIRSTA